MSWHSHNQVGMLRRLLRWIRLLHSLRMLKTVNGESPSSLNLKPSSSSSRSRPKSSRSSQCFSTWRLLSKYLVMYMVNFSTFSDFLTSPAILMITKSFSLSETTSIEANKVLKQFVSWWHIKLSTLITSSCWEETTNANPLTGCTAFMTSAKEDIVSNCGENSALSSMFCQFVLLSMIEYCVCMAVLVQIWMISKWSTPTRDHKTCQILVFCVICSGQTRRSTSKVGVITTEVWAMFSDQM